MLFLYLHYIALFTKIHTWKLIAYGKISWKNQNRKKSLAKKGKKERKKQQKERKYYSVKKKKSFVKANSTGGTPRWRPDFEQRSRRQTKICRT